MTQAHSALCLVTSADVKAMVRAVLRAHLLMMSLVSHRDFYQAVCLALAPGQSGYAFNVMFEFLACHKGSPV